MAKYVDGFVLVVPKKKVKQYEKMASGAAKFWKKHGALDYYECVGNDLNPDTHGMKVLGFPKMVNLKKDETVWFSFIVYRNKKHRDSVNKKVMKDMEKDMEKHKNMEMPWDMKRFAWGGFEARVVR